MKLPWSKYPAAAQPSLPLAQEPRRRGMVVGAGIAGVAALAAGALHRGTQAGPSEEAVASGTSADSGYRLTEHIRRYYETTRS